jgi:hypothetical protein
LSNNTLLRHPAFQSALLLALCVAASSPFAEVGMNDDWSYAYSAKLLAQSGHISYNGWATAMLGWQLYWGALFIKLFGFSFAILRISTLVLSMLCAALLHQIFVRVGLTERNAVFCTFVILLSPLTLMLAFSFMSDIPGLFCLLGCLYLCIRAIQAGTLRASLTWLVAAAFFSAFGGTVRQITWLGVLVMVPCAAWNLRYRRIHLSALAAAYFVSIGFILCCMRWFKLQNYSVVEKLFPYTPITAFSWRFGGFVLSFYKTFLLVLPMMIAFVASYPFYRKRLRTQAVVATVLILVIPGAYLILRPGHVHWLAPFTENLVTAKGLFSDTFLLGYRPDVLPVPIRGVLTFVVFVSMAAFGLCAWNASTLPNISVPAPNPSRAPITTRNLSVLLGPFTLAYFLLTVTRAEIFDRYLLPFMIIFLIFAVRFYQRKVAQTLPRVSILTLLVFTLFGILGMHDLFATYRAQLAAANELRAAGMQRNQFYAGFEYDSWTQLELSGHINEPRVKVPQGAYTPWTPPIGLLTECVPVFAEHEPDIHAKYVLSFGPSSCYQPSDLPSVPFSTWMAPHTHSINILKIH